VAANINGAMTVKIAITTRFLIFPFIVEPPFSCSLRRLH
jgi:hypothetical protein